MTFVLFPARYSPTAECFFSHIRPRGKLEYHGYIMKHVWISAELRVAVLSTLNVASLALFGKGLRSAP